MPGSLLTPMLAPLLLLAMACGGPVAASATELIRSSTDVFGTRAIRSENLTPFPKWRGALERHFRERAQPQVSCRNQWLASCKVEEWQAFLDTLAGQTPEETLRRVNAFHNEARYILDQINWGIEDYWASPYQFFQKDGDCEDYAIAKFMSLRALGFPNERLRIVVLRDLNLRVAHAILVVELDGVRYVLDNQIGEVVPDTVVRHYQPIYSVNETHWWLHRRG